MTSTDTDTPAFKERKRLLAEDIMPNVLDMKRFLGKLNYDEQFSRRHNIAPNWEFTDKDTKTTFQPTLLGEVADPSFGTLLKAKGNYKPPKSAPSARVTDNTKVKNIIVLRQMHGSNTLAERAFINQTAPLNKIKEEVEAEDDRLGRTPMNPGKSEWVDSSAEALELPGKRHLDLIVVTTLNKFTVPPTGSKAARSNVITKVQPLTDNEPSTSLKGKEKEEKQTLEVGMYYEPSLLPDLSKDVFDLTKSKLMQHDTRDINNDLIPAWNIERGLRPGTIVIVSATLHVFNIKDKNTNGFRRFYQINAEKIRVVAEPLPDDLAQTPSVTVTEADDKHVIDDFGFYNARKKRNVAKEDDGHAAKKTKKGSTDTDAMNIT